MGNTSKWSKIESQFERMLIKFGNLSFEEKEAINNIPDEFLRHFQARSAVIAEKMKDEFVEYKLDNEVISLIDNSIIEDFPNWKPVFFDKFYIIFKKQNKRVKALWGCIENNYLMICGEQTNGSVISSLFKTDFENQDFDFGKEDLYSEKILTDNQTGLYFVKFLLTFALLLEAEKTPLEIKEECQRCSPSVYGGRLTKILKTIKLKKEFAEKLKQLKIVKVRGFLRNQAYGENWSKHRIIYIAPFEREQKVNKE